MMPPNLDAPTGDDTMAKKQTEGPAMQVGVRLEAAMIERLDALAKHLSRPGLALTRADAVRIALATGLDAIEHEKRR